MAGSLNRVTLIGNLGQDPDVRSTQSGSKVAAFSLATNENWIDKRSGERVGRTEWHRIVVLNENLAEIVAQYVSKGDKLYVEGALRTREWTDNDGVKRYMTEVAVGAFDGRIVLLSGRNGKASSDAAAPAKGGAGATPDRDDEGPF